MESNAKQSITIYVDEDDFVYVNYSNPDISSNLQLVELAKAFFEDKYEELSSLDESELLS